MCIQKSRSRLERSWYALLYIYFLHIVMNVFKSKKQGWYVGVRKNMLSSLYKLEPVQVEVGASIQ